MTQIFKMGPIAFIFEATFFRFYIKVRLSINFRNAFSNWKKNKKINIMRPAFFPFFENIGFPDFMLIMLGKILPDYFDELKFLLIFPSFVSRHFSLRN